MFTGQVAACAVIASLAAAAAQTGNRFQIEGLAPGDKVLVNSSVYADYKCGPSKFEPDVYCTRVKRDANSARGTTTTAILHRPSGEVLFISNTTTPLTLSGEEIDSEINRLNRIFGSQPHVVMPPDNVRSDNDAALVTWGNIRLRPIDAALRQTILAGGTINQGFLVDHLNDLKKSISEGLPVYQIEGGRGFIFAANWDRDGRGTIATRSIDQAALQPDVDRLALSISQLQADIRGDLTKLKGTPQAGATQAQIAGLSEEFAKPEVSSDRAKLQGLKQRLDALAAEPPAAAVPAPAPVPTPPSPPPAAAVPIPPPAPPAPVVVTPPQPPAPRSEEINAQAEAATKARDDAVRVQGELRTKAETETKARSEAETRLKAEQAARQKAEGARQKAESEVLAARDDFQRAMTQVQTAEEDRQHFENYFYAALLALAAVLVGGGGAFWSLLRRKPAPVTVVAQRRAPSFALSPPLMAPVPPPPVPPAPKVEPPPVAQAAAADEDKDSANEATAPSDESKPEAAPAHKEVAAPEPAAPPEETSVAPPKALPPKRGSGRKGGRNAKAAEGGDTGKTPDETVVPNGEGK
ncbi:cell envelope integrity protein TolA [Methylovirgula sp. 4M-Z18]|uniref:cell envelope integrity protein TolA n=1 Tax=Methylovirgula sp. 4M-Z18 TaxID=2293567 RepID=UPI001314008E|nr:cell envelope integrity protein TolA [Methylovirgula sp. 4M-Z18]